MSTTSIPPVDYSRQREFVDPEKAAATHVTIIGCGTVGSHAAHELARLGIGSLTVIDADTVGPENLPSQRYMMSDVGRPKAEALADGVRQIAPCTVEPMVMRLEGAEPLPAGPVILAVDSMESRKAIMDFSLAMRPTHPLVIEVRMGGDSLQMMCLDPCERAMLDRWATTWFPDEEAEPIPCGGRSVSYIGAVTGAMIASAMQRHLKGEPPVWMTHMHIGQNMIQTFGENR